ncbi:hypothetical protein AAKU67_003040 [Oxalobacteraceae bacterium GrIS 2.11]
MFKETLFGAAVLALLAAGSASATTNVITTGPVSNSAVGSTIIDSNDFLDGQITLTGPQAISSIQAYLLDPFGAAGDNFNITLYGNTSNNQLGNLLYSGTATYSGTDGWNGLSNLNWAVTGGTYWVGLEVTGDQATTFFAPTGAASLLANTAFSANGGSSYSYRNISGTGLAKDLNFGLTVTSIAAVPEADEWLMMLLGLGVVGFLASRRSGSKSTTAFA